jgi:hypothetical protein
MTSAKEDLSISMLKANIYSLLFGFAPAAVLVAAYIVIWGLANFAQGFSALFDNLLWLLLIFIFGIVIHELLHGITWVVLGRKPFSAIKFGVTSLTPYAHLKEPVEVNVYRWGTFMPGLVLGFLPAVWGMLTGNGFALLIGALFIVLASGDLLILWLIRKVPAGRLVEDHPSRAGCYVLDMQS